MGMYLPVLSTLTTATMTSRIGSTAIVKEALLGTS